MPAVERVLCFPDTEHRNNDDATLHTQRTVLCFSIDGTLCSLKQSQVTRNTFVGVTDKGAFHSCGNTKVPSWKLISPQRYCTCSLGLN